MKNIAKLFLILTVLCFTSCENTANGNNEPAKRGTLFVYAGTASSLEIANNSTGYTFPDTFLNQSNEISVTIKNTGEGTINLTGKPYINLDGATTVFSVSAQPEASTISPGTVISFKIKFSPVNATESYVYVSIPNNSKNEPDFSFTVYGTGIRPKPVASIIFNNVEKFQNETIDAGDVLFALSTDITVTIKNDGQIPLEIVPANISISGADAAAFTITSSPNASIQAGDRTQFIIKCKPVKLNENRAVLTIPTNDASRNPVVVNLRVNGKKGTPVLALTQGSNTITNNTFTPVDFGTVEISSYNSLLFTITNNGDIPLELTGNPAVESSNAVFTVSSQPVNKTIDINGSISFMLRFTPSAEGEVAGKITIANNTDAGEFSFPVKGNGFGRKPQIIISYNDVAVPQNGTIDAGEAIVTQSKLITVTIKNTGEIPLTINPENITITGADAAAFTKITNPFVTTQTGGQSSFNIEWRPVKQGENNAILSIPSNDSARNPAVVYLKAIGVKGTPVLELRQNTTVISNNSLTPFDFGRVLLNGNNPLTFTIKNAGDVALELTGSPAVASSSDFFTVLAQPGNTTLQPNTSTEFTVRYAPTTEGEDTGYLTILNTGGGAFTLNVKGTGYIRKPQIAIKQESAVIIPYGEFDFGASNVGAPKDITFAIENVGEANLTFVTVEGNRVNLADNADGIFSVTLQPLASTILTPGNKTDFTVRFTPKTAGITSTATVIIKTNSENYEEFAFRIRGTAGVGYKIGDTGPGGGIIFYAVGNQFKECTQTNLGTSTYNFNTASSTASSYTGGGFTNWYLPTRDELSAMYLNLHTAGMGSFTASNSSPYWSRTNYSTYSSYYYYRYFGNGNEGNSYSGVSYGYVRAVRSFTM